MTDEAKRGDYDLTDFKRPNDAPASETLQHKEFVIDVERAAIEKRRQHIRDKGGTDRTACPMTGLALSGGGIRSASFGLGALQALQAKHENHPNIYGIEGIDYLSTVSGGGYIGCSLTAPMQKTEGEFPFTKPANYDDTASVRHIRDYSNYLVPHGALDVVTALGIIGRGLVANVLIVLPVLLFFVWFTLLIHPSVKSLREPMFLVWNLKDVLASLGLPVPHLFWDLPGYWFTAFLMVVNVVFLVFWVFFKSISVSQFWQHGFARRRGPGESAELRGVLATISQVLFFVTVTMAWLETQPFILMALSTPDVTPPSGAGIGKILQEWFANLTPWLAPFGAIFAVFSKYFNDIVGLAARDSRWQARLKKILAMTALWFAAIVIPSFLWLIYLKLTYFGLSCFDAKYPFAPRWLLSLAKAAPFQGILQKWGVTTPAGFYFELFVLTGLFALFINPNVTSLYRLYRDRLSKAFLFDPGGQRDKHDDLPAYEPKLHKIDTNLCPYPIVNASLNIEGSQYANKRGRNADFFAFTPEYTGSDATGYIGTRRIEEDETALDLGTAMAISAAAVSSNMGALTIKPLAFTLALLNVRLGYWLRNPRRIVGHRPWYSRLFDIRSFLLFKEAFSWITEKSPTVLLTDGGHVENLGIYSLLKRRCKVIIAIDAIADPAMGFGASLTLERYSRIDLGATVDLPWKAIRDQTLKIDKTFDKADEDSSAISSLKGPHCAAGEIQYGPNETGILLYVKASLNGDESDYILDYKRHNRAFPHETTGDQFFSEEQLEVYRALGFHIMKGLLTGDAPFTVKQDPREPDDKKRVRILSTVRAALLGTPPKP